MARRTDKRDPGRTMQIDALVDELEDLGPPSDFGPAPPPLPPKRAGKTMWIVGALVVLLMAGLGIGLGVFLFGAPEPSAATRAPAPAPVPQPSPAEPSTPPAPAEPRDVVQMDEVVFGAERPAASAE
jgi:hypothetical protein